MTSARKPCDYMETVNSVLSSSTLLSFQSTEQSSNDKQKSYSILLIEFETIRFSDLFRSAWFKLVFHV